MVSKQPPEKFEVIYIENVFGGNWPGYLEQTSATGYVCRFFVDYNNVLREWFRSGVANLLHAMRQLFNLRFQMSRKSLVTPTHSQLLLTTSYRNYRN